MSDGRFHPAPQIAFISEEAEEMVPVRRAEIQEFAAHVVRVARNPVEAASAWAFTWLGVAAGSAISLLALFGVEGTDARFAVVLAHIALCVVGGFLAAFCGWIDWRLRKSRTTDAEELSKRIAALDARAPRREPDA